MEKQNTPHRLTQQQLTDKMTKVVTHATKDITIKDLERVAPIEMQIAKLCVKVCYAYELGMEAESIEEASYYADIIDTHIISAVLFIPLEEHSTFMPDLVDHCRPLKLLTAEFRADPKNSPRRHEREADDYAKKNGI